MEQEEKVAVDLGSLGSFDFTPDWAKKDAGVTVGRVRPANDVAPDGSSRERSGDRKNSPRKPFAKKPFERKPRFTERLKPLDAEVKVLPETKALGTIIRKLQQDCHAYKLKDIAYFFLDNPQSVLLKVTPKGGEKFVQCKICGFASTREEDVLEHIVNAHFSDYYDSKEIEVEPPKGNFSCVARCGLSGVLLGPPNIHEYNSIIREMIRTRYPEMSEEQYRSHIEMVRDSEAIEQWRAGAVKKTVFVPKGQAEAEGVAVASREQAEGEFRRNILPSLTDTPRHLMITADVAMKSPVRPLQWLVRDALEAERRAPYAMCYALRGAFHHRKMNFFRANDSRGPEFVIGIELKPFDIEHAIPELAEVARFIEANPCCDKNELPGGEEAFKHLQWLVSTGHAVAFTNGVYSAVEKFPKYGPQWKKRPAKMQDIPAPAESAAIGTASAAPEPAESAEVKETSEVKEEEKNETAAQLAE